MLLTRAKIVEIFSSQPSRLDGILSHRRDLYTELAAASGPISRRADEILGTTYRRHLQERARSPNFRVSRDQARKIKELFSVHGPVFGHHEEVREILARADLGSLLESDHLIEQRFIEHIMDGSITTSQQVATRTPRSGDEILDTFALAVPKNEIVYYRIAKAFRELGGDFRLGGLYPHVGPGSKTTQLAELLPPTFESLFSLRDIANAHRWVLIKKMGLPREPFEDYMLKDIADAIDHGMEMENSGNFRRAMRAATHSSGNPTQRQIVDYLKGSEDLSAELFFPPNWPHFK